MLNTDAHNPQVSSQAAGFAVAWKEALMRALALMLCCCHRSRTRWPSQTS